MTPCFQITNRKKDYTDSYSEILLELTITDESTEKGDSFTLRLDDTGNTIELPQKGERITVALGVDGEMIKTGSYVVDEISIKGPPDTIEITGKAAPFDNAEGQKAMQAQKTRSFDEITIGNLIQQIATEHGLTAAVSDDLKNMTIPHLDQTNESDNNLLYRLSQIYCAVYKVTTSRLVFASGNDGKTISGENLGTSK